MSGLRRLCLAAMVCALFAAFTPSVRALDCEGTPLDGGCLFTVTGGDTPDPDDGFAVTNAADVPLWDFVQARDLDALGYPISQRWTDGPFTLQAFQKVILQWDPAQRRMNYYNTLDALANRYPDVELPFVPAHQVLAADQDAEFGTVTRNHLALLEHNTAIKRRFLAEPDWLNLYGLPIRYEEREVEGNPQGVQLLRTQRTVFVIWNVPAPGTTMGRVLLQNLPDQVKQLSGVIIPDRVKTPVDEESPEVLATRVTPTIHALPWASDGITPLEQEAIDRLQAIATASPDLFWYLMRELDFEAHLGNAIDHSATWSYAYRIEDPVGAQPTTDTLQIYDLLADIARLAWVQDGLTARERETAETLINSAFLWPTYVEVLLAKSWVRDSLSWEENRLIHVLRTLLNDTGLNDDPALGRVWETPPSRPEEAANIGIDILTMPFLDIIDGHESNVVIRIGGVFGFRYRALQGLVAHLKSNGGLTDEQALRLWFLGLASENYTAPRTKAYIADIYSPELLDQYLDPVAGPYVYPYIYQRDIVTRYSARLPLIILSELPVARETLDAFEATVRDLENTMGIAFPFGRAIMLMGTEWFTSYAPTHLVRININIGHNPDMTVNDNQEVVLSKHSWAFAHEIAHYYFHSGGEWLSEGATTFLEALVLEESSIETGEWGIGCATDRIEHIVYEPGQWFNCPYVLGADLFLDLHNSLGSTLFSDAFRRLHVMLLADLTFYGPRPDCCEYVEPGLFYIRRAFVTEAPAEVAAIAEPIIQHRYYVGDR